MTFRLKYHCGEEQIGEAEDVATLDEAHIHITAKCADLSHKADLVMIFRVSPSGIEELEESRKLHV